MNYLFNTLWIEIRKATRSRMPLFTMLGFLLLPLIGALFMVILGDPEFARKLGLISVKAQLVGGSADWPTYLGMFAQGIGIGGIFLFGMVATWVFGREFADSTVVDLLAVPVPRAYILLSKFILVALWGLIMTTIMYTVGLGLGFLLDLPLGSTELIVGGTIRVAVSAILTLALSSVVAFAASAGRGYLAPAGFMFLSIVVAQVVSVLGWGEYFPWAIPGLYAGMVPDFQIGTASYWIVALTGLAGMAITYFWWQTADQT